MKISDITTGMECSVKVKGIRARQAAEVKRIEDTPASEELREKGAPPIDRKVRVEYKEAMDDDTRPTTVWPAHIYQPVKRKKAED